MNDNLQKIKKLAIIALFTDDDLMHDFVLKGGTALELAYDLNDRASIDIDVSMGNDFNLESISPKLKEIFIDTFDLEGYYLFDFKMFMKPGKKNFPQGEFWGGYCIEFKVISKDKKNQLKDDIDTLRRNAEVVDSNNGKTYKIDISKYECCTNKQELDFDGYSIYVYTPVMIVNEKLRAICQQMDEYRKIVPTNRRQRSRDFFDIHNILTKLPETRRHFYSDENKELLKSVFEIKKVPFDLIYKIKNERDFHAPNFNTVKNTVSSTEVQDFDFYFDYVVDLIENL
ncbi:nucleotidyl transferase AbiEii/AbiGii toxin family protein [Paraclostridium sordellii]|uniref:nucleotidyl transferase AbiEii/AbiGii toxin family protein n=1 Tax=Paraclostridium sordellii TaxID=1505 RepID=UPI0005E9EF2A|nr:nucleotidyl transferase AbiEii/AbiGii toxin family protein [Paeniclostridium sordellii]CEP43568.1 Nucleotidyl transferase of uncharacterised function (DUF1814) [[Clostridium] sordellii] [Paeniclostridium sordellii]